MTGQLELGAMPTALPNRFSAAEIAAILRRYRLPVSNEAAMQEALARALSAEGVPHRREVTRGADRIDFVVGRVGLELKVKGSVTEVRRQLDRYTAWPELDELVLVTTRGHHLRIGDSINGKPVRVHIVRGMF